MSDKKTTTITGWIRPLLANRSPLFKAIAGLLATFGALALLYLIYSLLFLGRVYPRVMVGDTNFARLKIDQVHLGLEDKLSQINNQPINLRYQDKTFTIKPDDVAWNLDVEQSSQNIYKIGRSAGGWQSFYQQLKAPFVVTHPDLAISFDSGLLDQKINDTTVGIDVLATNALGQINGNAVTFDQEKTGSVIDHADLQHQILQQWQNFHPAEISLVTVSDQPKIILGDQQTIRDQVEKLSQTKLTLSWPSGKKELARKDIRQLIGFVGSVELGDGQPSSGILTADFTTDKIQNYLATTLAPAIDQPAKDPKLVIDNGKVRVDQPAKDGNIIDLTKTAKDILTALKQSSTSGSVQLSFKADHPVFTEDKISELGITQLIGRGETSFSGSPENRRHNIMTGISFLQSSLIKPGDEFSTVKTLGKIDNTTGYLPELVIKEDKTIPEFGGGLCQVSTTLFRAVLNAGLKVTARTNHSYRVSYYEPPIGLDATIYDPQPDFKFLNDTGHYILVQGRVSGNKAIFEFWGTSDGRTSSLTTPVVTDITDPPPAVRTDTDTLPKGTEKQVGKPHQGAKASVTYTVVRGGQVINKQTFRSLYDAIPEQIQVGTHEDNPPPA